MTLTPGVEKLPHNYRLFGLDHLRAFAIFYVFLFHYSLLFPSPEWLYTIGKFGWTGVDLFFVLSGYLISSQLFAKVDRQEKISFKVFFLKRFFRIIPAYLVVVALYFLWPSIREREAPAPLWKYLTFTQNLGLDVSKQGTFSHAWSLCIEEQFYLFLPLLLIGLGYLKAMKQGAKLLLFFFIAGFCARLYMWYNFVEPGINSDGFWIIWYKWIYYPTYSRLDGLLVGVSIAALFQFRPQLKQQIQNYGNYLLLAGIALLTGAYFICENQASFGASIFGFPLISLGYGLVVMAAINPKVFLYRFPSKITSGIATLSYAVYLIHKIVVHVSQEQLSKLDIPKESVLMFVLCVLTSITGAWLLNRLVEKPFLKLRDKMLKTEKHRVFQVE
ncbi:acyltransferase [Emticicia sp. BO119]|uniref:acyltransferase family protein n=1 Tax=Emticicia sp. BO119 TaxID=2757768 RepID=UPI0015F03651|nr:acyltransferase [Emticicia sp. BO119]MBA4853827.1 acyltransferase [Emticicia sp. BO119]